MAKIELIKQGESLPFFFDRDGEVIDGFVCTIVVKQFTKDTAIISRIIPPTNTRSWEGFLTSTETLPLTSGFYWLTGHLVNATTGEDDEILIRFQVAPALAP